MLLGETTTKNLNVFLLGLAFLGLFASNYTMTNLQQTIIDSAMDNSTVDDPNSGYVEGELNKSPGMGKFLKEVERRSRSNCTYMHHIL